MPLLPSSDSPSRIVSLIPEATEILQGLGLGDRVVVAEGGGAPPTLRADLIFTSETAAGGGMPRASVRRAVSGLRPRPAVFALEPHSLGAILSDIKTVGDATGCQGAARVLIEQLRVRIDAVTLRSARALVRGEPPRVVCLQRREPPVAAGWWLAELVGLAGGVDVLNGAYRAPRAVTRAEVDAARPDLVITVDEGCHPGPGAVTVLEQFAASILLGRSSGRGGSLDSTAPSG